MKRARKKDLHDRLSSGQDDLLEPTPFPLGAAIGAVLAAAEDEVHAMDLVASKVPEHERAFAFYVVADLYPRRQVLVKAHADHICSLVHAIDRREALDRLGVDLRERVREEVLRRFAERQERRANAKTKANAS